MNLLARNLLILASAGSGKTHQLGHRVIALVAKGVPPERIVALTFTRKAAGEFADAVLNELARAAGDGQYAAALREALDLPDADFSAALERVVRALPRLMLSTMDAFFARVVRSFQYELGITGGRFELLEGPRLDAAREELQDTILNERIEHEGAEDGFFHAFRRTMAGREDLRVGAALHEFIRGWQAVYRDRAEHDWGPAPLAGVEHTEWEKRKHDLLDRARAALEDFVPKDKRQKPALDEALDRLAAHTIGSGSLARASKLLEQILAAAASPDGPLKLSYYKEFTLTGTAASALREAAVLAARCELSSALARTRGVREVMAVYDVLCETRLRRRGWLGFDDIKQLMGRWARDETSRLRREAVDFRLDARYEHWLLDEFQDTSRAEWTGLQPLLDEAASGGEGSLFVVGDRKQAIYGWRGGEVGLFDELRRRYGGDLDIASMAESWRSCPQVLELVNRVCGDGELLEKLFGPEAASRWQWEEHASAPPLAAPSRHGEARVEIVAGKGEGRMERLVALLGELGVGRRDCTCGVLVRDNAGVREITDLLRDAGLDVIEDGRREPAKDHPAGVLVTALLEWLSDPAHGLARGVVAMSPLAPVLLAAHGGSWSAVWSGLTTEIAERGMAAVMAELAAHRGAEWTPFGRRRMDDLIAALEEMDGDGGVSLREAADRLRRMQLVQGSGLAAVQVMTIHKSKGLGFDIVVLPEISGDAIPSARNFSLAAGQDWLTLPPPQWARQLLPEIRAAEEHWGADQRYEAMCLLYVALTRAKRGLYILLDPPPEKRVADHSSFANWLDIALNPEGVGEGIAFQSGDPGWIESVPEVAAAPPPAPPVRLAAAVPCRARHRATAGHPVANGSGSDFGRAFHAVCQGIGWLDEALPLPDNAAGRLMAALLATPAWRAIFSRPGPGVELRREQPVDALVDGGWMSGVIDRLHLHRDAAGGVVLLELFDFKTDAVAGVVELLERHRPQLEAYRAALSLAYPQAVIRCLLASSHLQEVVVVD